MDSISTMKDFSWAMGKRAQQLDAELAKQKLGFNLIRTSHYPQSVHFLDRCDELVLRKLQGGNMSETKLGSRNQLIMCER